MASWILWIHTGRISGESLESRFLVPARVFADACGESCNSREAMDRAASEAA